MTFEKIKQAKIADSVVKQLEGLILDGVLEPGEKLPSERDLAQQLDVSRPSLREALYKLEAKGLIESRQGGGTYVKSIIGPAFTDPLVTLFQEHEGAAVDYVEFRKALEGVAAYYAALRGTESDREIITARFHAMEDAHNIDDPEAEAEADADFHLSIAEAAHNVVLLHIMRGLFKLLRQGVFYNRRRLYTRKGARELLLRQHRALFDAIMEGDPETAREAALTHLGYVQESMREMGQESVREDVARRRLERFKHGGVNVVERD